MEKPSMVLEEITNAIKKENQNEVKKKNLLIDHVTKKVLVDTPKELIRQDLEMMVHNLYSYPLNVMDIDVVLPIPENDKMVSSIDLVIKKDNEINTIFKIIEKDQETDSLKLYFKDAFNSIDSLEYCVLYDGINLVVFEYNKTLNEIADFPSYYQVNGNSILLKKDLVPADKHLKQIFKNIHNHLYANSNIRIASRIGEEVVKLILCKIEDENSSNDHCSFFAADDENNISVKTKITKLWVSIAQRLGSYTKEEINLDEYSISYVVKKLQKFSFTNTQSDILGESFQIFIDQSRLQDLGAFFTEIQAVKLAMEMIDIKIGKDNFIDPFQGTGGFIQEFFNRVEQHYENSANKAEDVKNYCLENLSGMDIEEEILKISEAKMITLGGVKYNSFNENSLENPLNWSVKTQEKVIQGSYNKIGTNPPFGTKISIQSQDILKQYNLSRNWKREKVEGKYIWNISPVTRKRNPRVPDILGLERVVQLLKTPTLDENGVEQNAGMAAVVLPRQIFSGPKELYVREWIMRNTIVHAIVDLPMETFQPHTGTKTSIIIFSKRKEEKIDWYKEDHKIFMAMPSKIGHDRRGQAIYKRDEHGMLIEDSQTGEYIIDSDMDNVLDAWRQFKLNNEIEFSKTNSFTIKANQIELEDIRLDASYYSPETSSLNEYLTNLPAITKGEWDVVPLGDLVKEVFFPGRFKRNYVSPENGIPFLSGTNISQFSPVNVKHLSKKTKNINNYLIEKDWILITRSGTTGIVSLAPSNWSNLAVSDHVIRIKPNEEKMNIGYIYIYLKSQFGQALLQKGIYGSVVDEITPEFIQSIPIAFPKDKNLCNEIGEMVKKASEYRANSINLFEQAEKELEKNVTTILDLYDK
ncbi:N-6 DNA methylase [Priestia aryabhattai]|uniref:N-6 DNA methylase n=1 Tax=Priestia aryabhattai TaxID=412384 RepID=UPI00203F39A4|nr:N-6 DNA methylase [Priestia aryabhattai]MCM2979179.1 N-6 DNA methylase [Priestia aryabhattai]